MDALTWIILLFFAVLIAYLFHTMRLSDRVRTLLPGLMRDEYVTEYEIIDHLRDKGITVGPRLLRAVAKDLEAVIESEETDDDSDGGMDTLMRYRRRRLSDAKQAS